MTTSSASVGAGVAGWPIEHSRSPMIHQFWLDRYAIEGGYERFPVPPGAFAEFAARIGKDGPVGSNVTAPHKAAAFAACDRRTPVAQALGAVNTLWREDGLLWGDNTDVAGFLGNLDESAPGWDARRRLALVVGAGGAARAIVYALVERNFAHILVVNRTVTHARDLAASFGDRVLAAPWTWLDAVMTSVDLLVNTSVLGMEGRPPLKLGVGELPGHAVVADIVYVPLRTPLIEAARARGLRTAEGLGMLLHQAAPSFERWFGRRPDVTPELRALVEADVRAGHQGREANQ
jgi:shikimate dehydrogenase